MIFFLVSLAIIACLFIAWLIAAYAASFPSAHSEAERYDKQIRDMNDELFCDLQGLIHQFDTGALNIMGLDRSI